MKPRSHDAPSTLVTITMVRTMSAKYDGAPISLATDASAGAKKTTSIVPMVPAMKDPMAAVARACEALPALAIRLPSSAVITDADSPGVLSRIAVVEPPYMPP